MTRYPIWLNFIGGLTLILIPIGLVLLFVVPSIVGLGVMGLGFLSLWVFGFIASKMKLIANRLQENTNE